MPLPCIKSSECPSRQVSQTEMTTGVREPVITPIDVTKVRSAPLGSR
jgi:hypothetical protein